ncbi:hypothetical protein P4T79_00170 [Bacillus mojavensis]|nr:hypothetical protein [Bacillus mojavensis]
MTNIPLITNTMPIRTDVKMPDTFDTPLVHKKTPTVTKSAYPMTGAF